jgi:hypothetical protein
VQRDTESGNRPRKTKEDSKWAGMVLNFTAFTVRLINDATPVIE